jgi:hypothetical protein
MHAPLISTLASSSEETSLVAAGEEVDKSLGVRVQVGTIASAGQVCTFVLVKPVNCGGGGQELGGARAQ